MHVNRVYVCGCGQGWGCASHICANSCFYRSTGWWWKLRRKLPDLWVLNAMRQIGRCCWTKAMWGLMQFISIASVRIKVENYYGRMKSKFCIMSAKWRGNSGGYSVFFKLCMALTNFEITKRPLWNEPEFPTDQAVAHTEENDHKEGTEDNDSEEWEKNSCQNCCLVCVWKIKEINRFSCALLETHSDSNTTPKTDPFGEKLTFFWKGLMPIPITQKHHRND